MKVEILKNIDSITYGLLAEGTKIDVKDASDWIKNGLAKKINGKESNDKGDGWPETSTKES